MNEDAALGFLLSQNLDIYKSMGLLNKYKSLSEDLNMKHVDHVHFERIIFAEHKLDMISDIFDSTMKNKLFHYYYTKHITPLSFSEIFSRNSQGIIILILKFCF